MYLHNLHLCCSGEQLGQASLKALPADTNVLALLCQQLDEGGQQLQVTGWSHLRQCREHDMHLSSHRQGPCQITL